MTTESGEDRLIARHFRPLATHPGAFNLIDDVAVLTPPAHSDLVLKADAIVGGVHFFLDDPPDLVARKALRVNLSDLAAKGARPLGFLLTLAIPATIDDHWLASFARGLGDDASAFGCPLMGGDTVRTPGPPTVSVAIFGAAPSGRMPLRTGARPGDLVVVTGSIGDATLGLMLRNDPTAADRWSLTQDDRNFLIDRYLLPQPRLALSETVGQTATAAMDISDGLAGDLAKLCRASGVDAEIDIAQMPFSPAAQTAISVDPALVESALSGGDDYEILATAPAAALDALRQAGARANVRVTPIGRIVAGKGDARFRAADGAAVVFARPSFTHF